MITLKTKFQKVFKFLFLPILTGLFVGGIVVAYNYAIHFAETNLLVLSTFLRNNLWLMPLLLILFIGVALLIRKLSSFEKATRGCGVPQVEGLLRGVLHMRWYLALPLVIICSFLAILCGVSLGGEGPSVLIGVLIAEGVAKIFRQPEHVERFLKTGGASAGLAASANMPFTGVVFALEEGHKRFSPVLLFSSLCTVAAAMGVYYSFKPHVSIYPIDPVVWKFSPISLIHLVVVGFVIALIALFFDKSIQKLTKFFRTNKFTKNGYAMLIPFVIAVFVIAFIPEAAGPGGETIKGVLVNSYTIKMLLVILLVKFAFTAISASSDLVGGIFVPIITLGALVGGIFGDLLFPYFETPLEVYVLCGMSVFFTIIAGAPITAIVISIELTGQYLDVLPVIAAVFGALMLSVITKGQPLYETMLWNLRKDFEEKLQKYSFTYQVEPNSYIDKTAIRDTLLPGNSSIASIERKGINIVPDGETELESGDLVDITIEAVSENDATKKLDTIFKTPIIKLKKKKE